MVQLNFNTTACIAKIAAKGKISNDEAAQLLQEVADRGFKMRLTGAPDPFVAAAGRLGQKLLKAAQERSQDAVLNAGKRTAMVGRIRSGAIEDMAFNARALLVNENGANKENVANFSGGLAQTWHSVVAGELRKAGLLKAAKSEKDFTDIAKAMWDARTIAGPQAPGRILDPATKIAQIIMKTMEAVRATLNGEGAHIGDAMDYVAHTSHNKELMLSGGRNNPLKVTEQEAFQAWWDKLYPLLNEDKTFEDVIPRAGETEIQARERFGRSAFEAMTTGVRLGQSLPDPLQIEFEGTRNIAKKVSQGRVFFFKDGESWAEYMKAYGQQLNALELAYDTIHGGARAAGNLHFLGTNPAANMLLAIEQAKQEIRQIGNLAMVNKFTEDLKGNRLLGKPGIEDLLYQVGAYPQSAINDFTHRLFRNAGLFANMTTLGSVGITHLASLPTTFYGASRGLEINSFRTLGGLIESMLPQGVERKAALSEIGALFDGAQVHNPYDNGFSVPGMVSSLHSAFMTATGIRYIMRHAKSGFVWMVSQHLANQSGKTFDQLAPMMQQTLKTFGLDAQKWELIRGMKKVDSAGRSYVVPSEAYNIPDAALAPILGAAPREAYDAYRREIANQLMMLYSRMGDLSTVTPGPREAAILHGSKNAGSDLTSLLTQFTAWPIAATHQLIGKTMYESLSKKSAVWTLGVAAGLSMLAGYGRLTIRNLISGRPPDQPKTGWGLGFLGLRSMMAGGIGGVLGDHLFGSIGQAAGNSQGFGGPIVGTLGELGAIAAKYAAALSKGTKYDPWPALVHLGASNFPFANLFYLKGALDYLIFYHLFEAIQPGWWDRVNQARLKAGQGKYAGYFPGAPIPYTPFGIGAGR